MDNHNEIKILISAYLDGETSPEESRIVEQHIEECSSCKQLMKESKKLSEVLTLWNNEILSPDLEQKITNKIKEKTMKKTQYRKTTSSFNKVIARNAILVIALVAIIGHITPRLLKTNLQGRVQEAADNIGDQFSVGNQGYIKTASVPGKDKHSRYKNKIAKSNLGSSIQYEPYYVETDYNIASGALLGSVSRQVVSTPTVHFSAGAMKNSIMMEEEIRVYPPVMPPIDQPMQQFNTEDYNRIYENEFLEVSENPLSTFSIDVDTASYSNVRRYLQRNQLPPQDSVRIEELVNYFSYDYPKPEGDKPFSVTTKASVCPWNNKHQLSMIGLQGIVPTELPPSNLVFLIDVSGSMNSPQKLPLLKNAFSMMVNQLGDNERVAIVVYAGAAGTVLESTPGSDKQRILSAINNLRAGGSTAGGAGIKLAYSIAKQNFIKDGNNRVILATDGDFNVGTSSDSELIRMIEDKRKDDIFLTILGFGTGNYKDNRMEQIANKGNGNYYYIDTQKEAKKVLVSELGSTLFTIAKDVKLQIEFNPSQVKAYRLLGYENRLLAKEDFNNDTKDAGELGAGHRVTALYEIVPADSEEIFGNVDKLKYQEKQIVESNEIMTVKLRYKKPDEKVSQLITQVVTTPSVIENPTGDLQFAASVVEFGLLLRNSKFKANASYTNAKKNATEGKGKDKFGYRAEFINLIGQAEILDSRSIGGNGIQFK